MISNRDIFKASLEHKDTGKAPVDFGATAISGMHVKAVDGLRKYYGLKSQPVKIWEPYQMLGLIEEDLAAVMGITVKGVPGRKTFFGFESIEWKEYTLDNGIETLVPKDFNVTKDALGNTYIYPEGDITAPPSGKMPRNGFYFDAIVRQQPFDEDNPNVEDNLEEFKYASGEDIQYQKKSLSAARSTDNGVITSFGGTSLGDISHVPAVHMKHPKGIRDIEEWYVTLATRKSFVHQLFESQTDIALANLKVYYEAVSDLPDAVMVCGTDFGTQNSTFCSKDTFRELFLPYYRKIYDWIHTNTKWKTFKHSCGAISEFIPLFIDAGFDILNPVQCSCPGMEPEKIKNEYGRDIVFWGGGVDTQHLLPFGKPADIRKQVLNRLEIFTKGGGYIFNAIHNIQADTPVENISAMIEAVKEFNA